MGSGGIDDLVQALALQNKIQPQIAASDSYAPIQSIFDQAGQFAATQNGGINPATGQNNYSTRDRVLAGLLSGLGAGVFQNLSQDYQGRATSAYNDVLNQTAQGNAPTEMPSVLNRDLFSSAKGTGDIFRTMQGQEREQSKNAIADKLKASMVEKLISEDPEAGIAAAKNLYGIDAGEIGPISDTNKELRKRQLDEIQARFKETQDKKNAETDFEGYQYDKSKIRPSTAEATKVRAELANNSILRNTLETLGSNIDEQGFMNMFGNNAQLQGALQSFIFNTQRKATGSGARLEGPEAKMLQAMTPSVAAGDFIGAIKAALLDRDPAQLAKDMIGVIDKSQDAMMKARYGATRIDTTPFGVTGTDSGLPSVGGIFNGKKVLSVKKVR